MKSMSSVFQVWVNRVSDFDNFKITFSIKIYILLSIYYNALLFTSSKSSFNKKISSMSNSFNTIFKLKMFGYYADKVLII